MSPLHLTHFMPAPHTKHTKSRGSTFPVQCRARAVPARAARMAAWNSSCSWRHLETRGRDRPPSPVAPDACKEGWWGQELALSKKAMGSEEGAVHDPAALCTGTDVPQAGTGPHGTPRRAEEGDTRTHPRLRTIHRPPRRLDAWPGSRTRHAAWKTPTDRCPAQPYGVRAG